MTKTRKIMLGVLVVMLCLTIAATVLLTLIGNKAIADAGADQEQEQQYKAPTHVGTWEHGGSGDGAIAIKAAGGTLQGGKSKADAKHYYLNDNVTITGENLTISGYVELCLNGYMLTGKSGSSAITVNGGATLVLYDCCSGDADEDGCNQQEHKHYYTVGEDGLYNFGSATENSETYIVGGVVTGGGGDNGGGVYVYNFSTLIMNGGSIAGNESSDGGGGVSITLSDFTMNGGSIQGNKSGKGGGVYFIENSFTMNGGTICNNVASAWGGGLYATNKGSFITLNGGAISGNTAQNGGGVVLVHSFLTMIDGAISDNTSNSFGGGVYIQDDSTFTMQGGTISENKAPNSSGGGVCITGSNGVFEMEGGAISKNTASSVGGVYVYNGTLTMSGGTISENTSNNSGGGVYIYGGTFTLSGGAISDNTASTYGGGVYFYSGTFEVSGAPNISDNTVDGTNANVYLTSGKTIAITGALKDSDGNNAHLGITLYDMTGVFTTDYGKYNSDNPSQYFVSDDDTKFVGLDFDEATIVGPTNHKHDDVTYFNEFDGSDTKLSAGKYYLTQDFGGNLSISGKVELCLNGYAITGNGGKVITVNSSATFVLHDCCKGEDCEVTEHKHTVNEVEIYGGVITGGNTATGAGVYATGTFVMNGGTIIDNTASNYGGGVCVYNNATFTMNGGTIRNNTGNYGGGVCANNATFILNGGTIQDNTGTYGGGVCVYNNGTFTMKGGAISQNTSTSNSGGGVYVTGSEFTLNSGSIDNNTASKYGGGVYTASNAIFTMNGGSIQGNRANGSGGGGVYVYGKVFTLNGGSIVNNWANSTSGGVHVNASSAMELSGTPNISGNTIGANSTQVNLYLPSGKTVTIIGALVDDAGNKAHVGVKLATGTGVITQDYSVHNGDVEPMKYFFADNGKEIELREGEAYLTDQSHEHSYVEEYINDEAEGRHYQECIKCDYTNYSNHEWSGWSTIGEEEHQHSCKCGATQTATHTWDDGDVTTDPSCVSTGVKTYTCDDCSQTKEETVDKVAHTSDNVWHRDADNHWNECSICNEQMNKSEHTWDEGDITTNPSCVSTGVKTYTCNDCSQTKEETVDKVAHTSDNVWHRDADNHWNECSICNEQLNKSEHTWNEGVITTKPTATDKGVKTFTCTVCGETKTEDLPATGSTVNPNDPVKPNTPTAPSNNKNSIFLWLLIILLIVLIADTAILIWQFVKRNKEIEEGGNEQ